MNSSSGSPISNAEASSLTMAEYIENERMLKEEYDAVLGASDEKACSYTRGAIKRQALYSCLTCCPESRFNLSKCAGICLACSLNCHANHELVELYTKRNFRCDCPTERFEGTCCLMNPTLGERQPLNNENVYDQNFQGVYCICHRPYPDPERTDESDMVQCTICEDWFHLEHINASGNAVALSEAFFEMVCDTCLAKHTFLLDYVGSSLNALTEDQLSCTEPTTNEGNMIEIISTEKREVLGEKPSDLVTASKIKKQENGVVDCCRPVNSLNKGAELFGGARFWNIDLRSNLCKCETCMAMYRDQKVEFLIDDEDSIKAYEERGKKRAAKESATHMQGLMEFISLNASQVLRVNSAYQFMYDQLKERLSTIVAANGVVTEEDIYRFFEQVRKQNIEDKQQ